MPTDLLTTIEDPEAKLISPSPDSVKGEIGKAYRVTVEGSTLSGVYIVEPATLICDPVDAAGTTAAVSYRGGKTTELNRLRSVVTFG